MVSSYRPLERVKRTASGCRWSGHPVVTSAVAAFMCPPQPRQRALPSAVASSRPCGSPLRRSDSVVVSPAAVEIHQVFSRQRVQVVLGNVTGDGHGHPDLLDVLGAGITLRQMCLELVALGGAECAIEVIGDQANRLLACDVMASGTPPLDPHDSTSCSRSDLMRDRPRCSRTRW